MNEGRFAKCLKQTLSATPTLLEYSALRC